jgi:type I restriction enzyme R subunit
MNLAAGPGIAVREFPLDTGPVYTLGVPAHLPAWRRPPPFAFESTGAVTQFTNGLEPDARCREVFTFHKPEELVRLAGVEAQVRGRLRSMPALAPSALWPVQRQTIENLERSLAMGLPRALIQMATGSGKTYTAAAFCERLIRFAGAKRVLFLVDRNTLGDQAHDEFQRYQSPYNGYRFTDEYPGQHARRNAIEPAAKVVITTIQRLYSMLKREPEFDEANEEQSMFESGRALAKEPEEILRHLRRRGRRRSCAADPDQVRSRHFPRDREVGVDGRAQGACRRAAHGRPRREDQRADREPGDSHPVASVNL